MSKLYNLLLHLHRSHGEGAATAQHSSDNVFNVRGLKVKFKDLCVLSDNLFKNLNRKFEVFFSALRDVSESGSRQVSELHSNLWNIVNDLTLVLRSCLVILTLLESEQKSLLEKCRYIHQMLKFFVSIDMGERYERTQITFENLVSGACSLTNVEFGTSVSLELSDPCRPFLCAVLEVFADEFLKHPSLRKYLMIVESSSSISGRIFMCDFNHGCIASVLEVISAHFILSVSDEQALENFISRLLLLSGKDSRDSELSLAASISLLLNPILLSAPKMIQAHVISLVSEAIGDGLSSENLVPDSLMDCYLTAFERSVILYSMHVSSLEMDGFYIGFKHSNNSYLLERSQETFETYAQQYTRNKLNHILSKLDNSWDSYLCNNSSKTKDDLLAEYIAFMKGSQHILSDSAREVIVFILEFIILRTSSENAARDVLYTKEDTGSQDICLLASILKLMSISLIQAIQCLSNNGNSGCLKTLGNASSRKRYDFLISVVNSFQQFNICLPIQNFLSEAMKSHQKRHKRSKSMLLHFSGLLSLSFIRGFDILAKACISVITALMHLFIFEEGDLIALGSLRDLPVQSLSSEIPLDKTGEGAGEKTSYKVASKFNKIRTRQLSMNSSSSFQRGIQDKQAEILSTVPMINSVSFYDIMKETCNGEIFLDCILGGSKRSSDYADLVDFIECKKGKDYNSWLKERQKYRGWKQEKMANLRKKKKKMMWKSMKCQKTSVSRR